MKQYCPQVLGKVLTLIISNNELRATFFLLFFTFFNFPSFFEGLFLKPDTQLFDKANTGDRWSFASSFLLAERNFNKV